MTNKFEETMKFKLEVNKEDKTVEILKKVYVSLKDKGYDPANQ
ncbi:IreB family regulatory phosphoprotein, partial [Helcococcus ovis]